MECNEQEVDALITKDQRVMVMNTAAQLGIGHSVMYGIIKTLRYQKICCHWVP
jgi:hypothetical protein